jgi:hypothetical protein
MQQRPSQLETLTGLEITDLSIGKAVRPSVFCSPRRLLSFVLTELLVFGLILIFCVPIGIVIVKGLGFLSGDAQSAIVFFQVALAVSVVINLIWQGYRWSKGRKLKTLAHLVDQVDRHNDIIQVVSVMDELGSIQNSTVSLLDRGEVIKALNATRESLMNALMTERILRKHQRFMTRRQELFASIETNLAALQALQVTNQANEYGHLLNEALQIGLSVRRELDQTQSG